MPENDKPVLVYSTFPSLTAAEEVGRVLLERGVAACVNILPRMVSIYRWRGAVERAEEVVMIVKTRGELAKAAMAEIKLHHEYDVPALLVLPVSDGDDDYIRWLLGETAPDRDDGRRSPL